MNYILATLFCIIAVSVINASWFQRPTSINEDATELTRLFEEYWSYKPPIFEEEGPLVICRFIDECCKDEDRIRAISSLISLIFDNHDDDDDDDSFPDVVTNKCINSTDLKQSIQSCPSLRNLLYPVTTKQEISDGMKYFNIFKDSTLKIDNLTNYEEGFCEKEDLHALLCSSNTTLVKRCFTKSLQHLYDNDGQESYQKYVSDTKQTFINTNQQLFQHEMKKTLKEIKPFVRVISKYYSKKSK